MFRFADLSQNLDLSIFETSGPGPLIMAYQNHLKIDLF